MICPRCQAQLPEGSVACNKCGLSFQYQQPVLLYKPPAKPKNTKKTVRCKFNLNIDANIVSFYLQKSVDFFHILMYNILSENIYI